MRSNTRSSRGVALLATFSLLGCGTTTPSLRDFYDRGDSDAMVEGITEHVQCEVRDAVQFLMLDYQDAAQFKAGGNSQPAQSTLDWLNNWAAQVTLVISVDEKTSLNPSISLTPPLASATTTFGNKTMTVTPQTGAYGIGATGSVDATRKGTISWLIKFKDLATPEALKNARVRRDELYSQARATGSKTIPYSCENHSGPFIEGDLQFRDWFYASVLGTAVKGGILGDFSSALSSEAAASKKDVIQDEVTFVVLYGGSVNPVWKLLRISADQPSPPLLGVQRTRTQDLLITLGPAPEGTISPTAQNAALASLIGIAVSNAIRNNQ